MKKLFVLLAALVAVAGFAFGQPQWYVEGPAQVAGGGSVTRDTVSFVAVTRLAEDGEATSKVVGFKAWGKLPFTYKITDIYGNTSPVHLHCDTLPTASLIHLPADPYTITGPEFPVVLEYWGPAATLYLEWASADTVTVQPYYD